MTTNAVKDVIETFERDPEITKIACFFPILDELHSYLVEDGKLSGITIGWHCHLTSLTAISAKVILNSGAKLFLSECNPATTDQLSVEYMKALGAHVYTGESSCKQALAANPSVISDTGFVMLENYLQDLKDTKNSKVVGACEITTSGVTRMREKYSEVQLPVININAGRLKSYIENYHGVGDGVVESLARLTGRSWAGSKATVVGYGQVGAGVAHYLARIGVQVSVCESDAVQSLIAHYDGYPSCSLSEALAQSDLLITATGIHKLLTKDHWQKAKDQLLVMNVGHWPDEVSPEVLTELSSSIKPVSEHLSEYTIERNGTTRRIFLATGGSPVNVAMLTGSPEPTVLHLATEILCMNYIVKSGDKLPKGEIAIPAEIEECASKLALRAIHKSTSAS